MTGMMTRFLLAFACLTLLAAPALAQDRVLNIQDIKTPKGITLWLVEDHSLPVLAIAFAFKSGASTDPLDKQGVSQLLSNTMDEGAADLKSEAFQGTLRDNAIDLSFDSARDSFGGSVRTLKRHQDKALDLLKKALTAPRFDPEPVERMKQANLTRIRAAMSDPGWIGARLMNDRIYPGHPYRLNSGGTLASMKALTPADLRAAWKRHAALDRLYVGIAGDITAEDAQRIVDDVFGHLPATAPADAVPDIAMPAGGKPVFFQTPQPQTNLSMVWQGIDIHDPDHYAGVVMDYIFGGGGFSSRLMTEIREARGLTYGIYSSMMNLDHADRFVVGGSMLPQNVQPTIDMVRAIATEMTTTDVTPDALAAARDYLTGSLPLHFSSSMNIAGAMTGLQIKGRASTALDEYRARIMAVTPADIRRVAARIFASDHQIILVGAKPEGIDLETVTALPNVEKETK